MKLKDTWFPWLQSHSQNPWRLLHLTRSDDRHTRHLGVRALAGIEDWDDYQYRYIAQACDARTLVGLARSPDVDERFFLPPPQLQPMKNSLLDELKELLRWLPQCDVDKCVAYFTEVALRKTLQFEDKGGLWTFSGLSLEPIKICTDFDNTKKMQSVCLEALARHSLHLKHCQEIVHNRGLQLLQRVVESRPKDLNIKETVARIIGNLALCADLHKDIIKTGWVQRLYEWMKGEDLSLLIFAARALANLDSDFSGDVQEDGIFVIHPVHRTTDPLYADIVFIHGIMGGPFKTWRQQDVKNKGRNHGNDETGTSWTTCWPKDWLAEDCPNSRIVAVQFDTHVSSWYVSCPYDDEKRTVSQRAKLLLDKLHKAGVGSRPIIWVAHSMGGLLVKQMLKLSEDSPHFSCLAEQTRGFVFYSVPHHGSVLANRSNTAKYILYPSVEVKELGKDSLMLAKLHSHFKDFALKHEIPCLSFGEMEKMNLGKKLPKMLIVPHETSDPGFGEFFTLPVDHINICKPEDRDSDLYKITLKFIKSCILHSRVETLLEQGMSVNNV
ncbi:protein SERAC1-like [Gigantopelta aegis]|uniref:protein SERAC1-like n=1 Tax=Gigantopelta aegis TaxID=1735272 RepID=UPI001B88837A|nr:protein SERAC1-like [Gigantopelta aegis]